VPTVPAHAERRHDEVTGAAADRPILLSDIDRVLSDSAEVARANAAAPIRAWHSELTEALESLAYARSVLAADVGILRHTLAAEITDTGAVTERLPAVLSGASWGRDWSAPELTAWPTSEDFSVCARSDQLLTAHEEMARTDLTSPTDVARALGELEHQLADLTARQVAVEARLREVRRSIVRQYRDGTAPVDDWLG
jgi:hypothetical protein